MLYFCVMRYTFLTLILFYSLAGSAQEKWDLKKCVEYALANNITIKQSEIQGKISALQYQQSKLGLYPSLSFSGGPAFNSGRNQDPTSYNLITQSYLSASMQLQSSAEIFNWFSKKNTILANQWQAASAKAATDKLKNDIALTVANAYLQILLAREQEKIASIQVSQTTAQLNNTQKLVKAGSLPELNETQLEAQLASDSSAYISAKGNVNQAVLSLKAYLNFDAAAPFDITEPPVELIPVEKIADLQPDAVYALAVINLPQQRVNDYNLKAAVKSSAAAKAALYPTFSAYGSLSSSFVDAKYPIYEKIYNGLSPTGLITQIGGVNYDVLSPSYSQGPKIGNTHSDPFTTQLSNNFRQSVGISISVPIFNGNSLRTNWQRAKLNIQNLELQKTADDQKIKQDIYQAYNAAIVALEKFNASKKSVETTQRSLDFAQKRYNVGMLGTFELITTQNNLFKAKLEYVLNQFDYVFKMKVLEFYKGQGLKL